MTADAIELGQRVVALLETGRRTATYKLALLMALVDHSVENYVGPEDPLEISLDALGSRVIEIYWRQVKPMNGVGALRQTTQPRARILAVVAALHLRGVSLGVSSADVIRDREPQAFQEALNSVVSTLVRQPLPRLQRLPGSEQSDPFLYDDGWMGEHVTERALDAHGRAITLRPGVAHGLARIAGLVRPVIEMLWVEDVVRLNAGLREGRDDVAGHLFGRERLGLGRVRDALHGGFGARCFYCGSRLTAASPVDHVLPWSRVGLDGLANLVPACSVCNASKNSTLPSARHLVAALQRDRATLEQIGSEIGWPVQWERTRDTARGLFLSSSIGTPLWERPKHYARVEVAWDPDLSIILADRAFGWHRQGGDGPRSASSSPPRPG